MAVIDILPLTFSFTLTLMRGLLSDVAEVWSFSRPPPPFLWVIHPLFLSSESQASLYKTPVPLSFWPTTTSPTNLPPPYFPMRLRYSVLDSQESCVSVSREWQWAQRHSTLPAASEGWDHWSNCRHRSLRGRSVYRSSFPTCLITQGVTTCSAAWMDYVHLTPHTASALI